MKNELELDEISSYRITKLALELSGKKWIHSFYLPYVVYYYSIPSKNNLTIAAYGYGKGTKIQKREFYIPEGIEIVKNALDEYFQFIYNAS